jgi:hypothetical protein
MAAMFRYGPGRWWRAWERRRGAAITLSAGTRQQKFAAAARRLRSRCRAGAPPCAIGGIGSRPRYGRPAAMVTRLLVAVFT